MNTISWLPSICRPGVEQMACDEALLNKVNKENTAIFRFYTWSEPTISLGYFQDYVTFTSTFPHLCNLAIVRRQTGGGAILHDREITYALIMPAASELYQQGAMAAYILVHQAIADVMQQLGVHLDLRPKTLDYMRIKDEPEFCFARPCPTDLICEAGKMVGSAQRRLPGAFLQHGSIMLENRFADQPMAPLTSLAKKVPSQGELEELIVKELAGKMGVEFVRREFLEDELAATKGLIDKYKSEKWTLHRER
jgi:lipoate-protein ligase A